MREYYHLFIVSITTIKLTTSEFWVMSLINALIPEIFANFINLSESSNDELLEVELGCYPHVEVHLVIVVIGFEWLLSIIGYHTAKAPP